jgi:3-hydroxyisobutyrate dehydrogenase-like beta-hydroxyacid dehydrogenase
MKVGFIGLRNMGNSMAGRLVKADFQLTIFDVVLLVRELESIDDRKTLISTRHRLLSV